MTSLQKTICFAFSWQIKFTSQVLECTTQVRLELSGKPESSTLHHWHAYNDTMEGYMYTHFKKITIKQKGKTFNFCQIPLPFPFPPLTTAFASIYKLSYQELCPQNAADSCQLYLPVSVFVTKLTLPDSNKDFQTLKFPASCYGAQQKLHQSSWQICITTSMPISHTV